MNTDFRTRVLQLPSASLAPVVTQLQTLFAAMQGSVQKVRQRRRRGLERVEIPDAFEVHKAPQYTVNLSRNSKHRKFD